MGQWLTTGVSFQRVRTRVTGLRKPWATVQSPVGAAKHPGGGVLGLVKGR